MNVPRGVGTLSVLEPVGLYMPVGGGGGVPSALRTVTDQKTPKSSIQVAPSMSGRR